MRGFVLLELYGHLSSASPRFLADNIFLRLDTKKVRYLLFVEEEISYNFLFYTIFSVTNTRDMKWFVLLKLYSLLSSASPRFLAHNSFLGRDTEKLIYNFFVEQKIFYNPGCLQFKKSRSVIPEIRELQTVTMQKTLHLVPLLCYRVHLLLVRRCDCGYQPRYIKHGINLMDA